MKPRAKTAKLVDAMMKALDKKAKAAAKDGLYSLAEDYRVRASQCEVLFVEMEKAGVFADAGCDAEAGK